MAYTILDPVLGYPKIAATSTAPWVGGQASSSIPPLGTIIRAVDPTYGMGEFIFLKGVASTAVGSWVLINPDDYTTNLLAADMKGAVAVAMSANVLNQFGWYQIGGKAIGLCLAGYLDNALVYTTATPGSVDDAVIATERVKNAIGASAIGVPSGSFAEFEINRPFVDDGSAA